jgi:hypothetical protein
MACAANTAVACRAPTRPPTPMREVLHGRCNSARRTRTHPGSPRAAAPVGRAHAEDTKRDAVHVKWDPGLRASSSSLADRTQTSPACSARTTFSSSTPGTSRTPSSASRVSAVREQFTEADLTCSISMSPSRQEAVILAARPVGRGRRRWSAAARRTSTPRRWWGQLSTVGPAALESSPYGLPVSPSKPEAETTARFSDEMEIPT